MSNTLYIGNRNYSSWSLRPWLLGHRGIADAAFREWQAAAQPDSWDKPDYPVIDQLHSR